MTVPLKAMLGLKGLGLREVEERRNKSRLFVGAAVLVIKLSTNI